MSKRKSEDYEKRVAIVREKLGRYYGLLLKNKYPDIAKEIGETRLRNAMCHHVNDWQVLHVLEVLAGIKTKTKYNNPNDVDFIGRIQNLKYDI